MGTCEWCGGQGTIERDGKLYNCECFYTKQASGKMPMQIRRANILPGHLALPLLNLVNNSIFIKGHYSDIKSIIKAVTIKYPNKWIKLTNDAEIRNVYVGSMSKSSRSDDFNGEIYNSIQDLIDPPDLIIIQLNVISNKNKAAPGALEESLNHRLINDKAIWAFSSIESPFTQSSYSYSPRVEEIIESGLSPITIPKITSDSPSILDSNLTLEPVKTNMADERTGNYSERKSFKSKKVKSADDSPLSVWGSGVSKHKKPFGNGDS